STSAEYFATYYGIAGFEKQLGFCQAVFDGQAPSYKPNDDAAGGWWGYCYLVPYHQVFYDLRRDDARFLEGGQLRDFADYGVMVTDSMGIQVAFGDLWGYRQFGTHEVAYRHKAVSVDLAMLLCTAAWYYEDGGYLWALDWMGGRPYPGCYYRALPKSPPERLAGVTVAPFNPSLYDWVERHAPGGANVALDEAFDKLTLREGFDASDLYVLLDGTSTFAHGHEDGNSILRLTWKGRMWLTEVDYIWRRPRHHNSVVAICDGESHVVPPLTALKWAEDFADIVFTRSEVPDRNGTDWQRDIVWSRDGFVLIIDSLRLLRDAEYDLRCLWRTLGEVRLVGDNLTAEQEGVHFRILNADASEKSLVSEESRVAAEDPYGTYPHADGPVRIFRQRAAKDGHVGDVVRFLNLMVAGDKDEVAAWEIERVDRDAVRVTGPTGSTVLGVSAGEAQLGDVRIGGGTYALTEDTVTLLGARTLEIGNRALESDSPVHLQLELAAGEGELRAKDGARVSARNMRIDGGTVSADGVGLAPGTHQLGFDPISPTVLGDAILVRSTWIQPKARNRRKLAATGTGGFETAWSSQLGGPVRSLDARAGEIAVGTGDGQVVLLGKEGALLWEADLGAEVRAVHLSDVAGGMLLAGGRDTALTCFDGEGQVRWKRTFAMSHGVHQNVNQAEAVDLEGDGNTAILLATDGWMVWALTPDNEVIWQRQIKHHAAKSFVIADVDGDGRQEILVGTEYFYSNLLAPDGTIRWVMHGGPCFAALELADLNGDGFLESVCGSMDGNVYAADSRTGEVLWTSNLGDDVRYGFAVDVGGRPTVVAGSESGNVALLDAEGKRIWRRNLDAAVTGLCRLDSDDGADAALVAATDDGCIVKLSTAGEITGGQQVASAVTVMQAVGLDGREGVVVGTEAGEVVGLVV
ncbi:MAG: PQQ-binding-like beta-propeller repeat protein, partial [Candidatus Latescibacteria bacterium]|nr:PQQ-binding-like beta-propeller repeat protein [Candidatus Latescibacterota bacterium]